MYYYQHNIGDFDKATRHLTRVERSVYRDLIELYYDTECQLNPDVSYLCRKILARTNEEVTAVEQVLNEFFTKTERGWYHDRCEDEICKYHDYVSQRSVAGKKSAAARKEKRQRALNERSNSVKRESNDKVTNQEPITNNQEPLTNIKDISQQAGKFTPPTVSQVDEYMQSICKGSHEEAEKFVDFYESKGWLVGKAKMKSWQAAVRNWTKNTSSHTAKKSTGFTVDQARPQIMGFLND